jgi:hypothetical protein
MIIVQYSIISNMAIVRMIEMIFFENVFLPGGAVLERCSLYSAIKLLPNVFGLI